MIDNTKVTGVTHLDASGGEKKEEAVQKIGIASGIIDLQGKKLIASRWQRIYTLFHRKNQNHECT